MVQSDRFLLLFYYLTAPKIAFLLIRSRPPLFLALFRSFHVGCSACNVHFFSIRIMSVMICTEILLPKFSTLFVGEKLGWNEQLTQLKDPIFTYSIFMPSQFYDMPVFDSLFLGVLSFNAMHFLREIVHCVPFSLVSLHNVITKPNWNWSGNDRPTTIAPTMRSFLIFTSISLLLPHKMH